MQKTTFVSGGLHHRMKAYTHMFLCFTAAFGDPVTALVLTGLVTVFLSEK